MTKADSLFLKVAGGAIGVLLGIVAYFSQQTYQEMKESRLAQQRQEVEIKTNKAEVEGYCKVMDIKFFNMDERMAEINERIERVEKILRIENEHYTD
jgi:NAD/NADP transhydrogenase alpha subunit